MLKNPSLFDYTLTLTRKYRYLVVGAPEFGIQLSSSFLDAEELSPEAIGRTVPGILRAERTPGGHLRFSIEALSEHLARREISSRAAAPTPPRADGPRAGEAA